MERTQRVPGWSVEHPLVDSVFVDRPFPPCSVEDLEVVPVHIALHQDTGAHHHGQKVVVLHRVVDSAAEPSRLLFQLALGVPILKLANKSEEQTLYDLSHASTYRFSDFLNGLRTLIPLLRCPTRFSKIKNVLIFDQSFMGNNKT